MDDPYVRRVLLLLAKRIDAERTAIGGKLADGVAKDHGEYREMVGRNKGLKTVEGFLDDIAKEVLKDESE